MTSQQLLAEALGLSEADPHNVMPPDRLKEPPLLQKNIPIHPVNKSVSPATIAEMMDYAPGFIGDAAGLKQAADDASEGNYGSAALNAAGSVLGPVAKAGGAAVAGLSKLKAGLAGKGAMAGIFAGKGAKTADLFKLAKAEEMEKAGTPREGIWDETGWWNTPGGWRYEIDDSGANLTGIAKKEKKRGVQETLDHPEFDAAFPGFRKDMELRPDYGEGDAYYDPESNAIGLHARYFSKEEDLMKKNKYLDAQARWKKANAEWKTLNDQLSATASPQSEELASRLQKVNAQQDSLVDEIDSHLDYNKGFSVKDNEAKSALLHELTHGVQKELGHPVGGSPETAQDQILRHIADEMSYTEGGDKMMDDALELHPYEAYRRLWGEAEARLASDRMNLSKEARQKRYPWLDLDQNIPESEYYPVMK